MLFQLAATDHIKCYCCRLVIVIKQAGELLEGSRDGATQFCSVGGDGLETEEDTISPSCALAKRHLWPQCFQQRVRASVHDRGSIKSESTYNRKQRNLACLLFPELTGEDESRGWEEGCVTRKRKEV